MRKNELETCTEMVTATILDASKISRKYGYDYYCRVRYVWMDEVYKVQIKSSEPLGNIGEETIIHIDPNHPKKIRSINAKGLSFYGFIMGIGVIVIGVVWVIGAIGYSVMR
ncbi:MAG: hypothetical protein IKN55_04575 [Oscillospiraceae bacterium]|nr:hypothetical protein [Oscillospiraceae bacterium]